MGLTNGMPSAPIFPGPISTLDTTLLILQRASNHCSNTVLTFLTEATGTIFLN